ncbi:hypothetical protein CPB97_002520 [Podila verticillata]|nr:hypothetical protein CPB97_002520 [Podila verticillata]
MTGQNLIFYTSAYCPFAARAAIAFEETQHPKESVEIDLTAPRPEWYLKEINPYGQVPALKINDEYIVLESLFVAEYLADLHPESGLLPKDALQRAQVRYLIHAYSTLVQPAHHKAAYTSDPEETVKHRAALLVELEKFEKLLTKAKVTEEGPYFLGKDFTLADLAIAPFLVRFFLIDAYHRVEGAPDFLEAKEVKEKLPRFLAWKAAIEERESVKKTTPDLEYIKQMYKKFIK